ncbi:hypothetical protein ACSQ67_018943 [Phaseolus vulgaris]
MEGSEGWYYVLGNNGKGGRVLCVEWCGEMNLLLRGGDIKGEEKRGRVGYSWVQGVVTLVAGEPMLTVSIAVVTLSPALHFAGLHPL